MTAAALDRRRRAEQAASRLPPLLIAAERVAATATQGAHGRRRVGPGDAFWQFRRYQPGDVPAVIDWRRSARADAVFVRENEWEAAQSVWLWRDGSGSMDYHSSAELPTKRDRAEVLLLALAILLTRAGERVALSGADAARPMSGRFAVERLAQILTTPEAEGAARGLGAPPAAAPPPPRHGRTVLLGDFLDPAPALEDYVRGLSERGVRGHMLQILDPAEEDLPFTGRVRLHGLEGEAPLLIPRIENLRDAYRRRLADRRDRLRTLARAAGWSFAAHHTDRPPHIALLALWTAAAQRAQTPTVRQTAPEETP